MRRVLLIFVSLLLVLAGWNTVCAEDGFYVIPVRQKSLNAPAPVPKTGQTTSHGPRDDGALRKGVTWPAPRFTDSGNGTVTDNLTGLIWTKNANAFGLRTWVQALSDANNLKSGDAGLTDGSKAGDWRLPNVRELHSLIDYGKYLPAMPDGHPFTNVQNPGYWSSSTYAYGADFAWYVNFGHGQVYYGNDKTYLLAVWCVRDAQ